MKPSRILSVVVFAVVVALAGWFHSQGGLPLDPTALRVRISEFGYVAPLGFMVIAALRFVFALPSAVVMTAGGLAFGFVWGTLLSSIGMALGAMLGFGLARGLGKDAVQQRMAGRLARADAFLSQRGPRWLAAYTALPVSPLTPVHTGAGLSSMAFSAFALWVTVGLVPRAALYSYFGDSFTRGTAAVVAAAAVLSVVVIVGIFVMRRMFGSTTRASDVGSQSGLNRERPSDAESRTPVSGSDEEI